MFGHELGNDSHIQISAIVNREFWTIHKDVLFAAMAVHIDECKKSIRKRILLVILQVSAILCNHLFDGADDWVELWMWRLIPTIEVIARHGDPVVASNDSVRVCAWNYFEDDSLSEFYGHLVCWACYQS